MFKRIIPLFLVGLLFSCGGEEDTKSTEDIEAIDTNSVISAAEELIEDGPNEFAWIENVVTYEGKDPDAYISLALMISGVRDTLDLLTIWSFPGKVSDEVKSMYGYPKNTVAEIMAEYAEDFITIQEKSETEYNILYSYVYKDSVRTLDPVGEIALSNGAINFSIDLPNADIEETSEYGNDYGSFFAFGESSPWNNFD